MVAQRDVIQVLKTARTPMTATEIAAKLMPLPRRSLYNVRVEVYNKCIDLERYGILARLVSYKIVKWKIVDDVEIEGASP